MKRVFAPIHFDSLGVEQIEYLRQARCAGDLLIVGVKDDRSLRKEGLQPSIPLRERIAILEALRFADEVVSFVDDDLTSLLRGLSIDVLAVDEDYGGSARSDGERSTLKSCQAANIKVVRLVPATQAVSAGIRSHAREFWNARAKRSEDIEQGVTVLGSFKGQPEKMAAETAKEVDLILQAASAHGARSLLDLGCGDGRQLVHLCPHFDRVVGVDFAPELLQVARRRIAAAEEVAELIEADVSKFCSPDGERFDLVLLSGILPCLDDAQVENLMSNLRELAKPGAIILVRTSVGTHGRVDVINQYSSELDSRYTAFYRTAEETAAAFARIGWTLARSFELYSHRQDTAVWWFELEPVGASHEPEIETPAQARHRAAGQIDH